MRNKTRMAHSNNSPSYRHSELCRTVFYAVFLLVLCAGFQAKAQEIVPLDASLSPAEKMADPYTVEDIKVDITADNAVEARSQAFEAAQIKGYEELAKRMLSPEEFESFETPDLNMISSYVRDYEVTNEKLSAVRYNGTYKIRFSKKAFRKALPSHQNMQGDIKQIVQTGDTLLLPFYQYGSRSFLWQANPFMNAWVKARNNNATGRAIIPVGDIIDITQVRDEQAQSYDLSRLNKMRQRYNATNIAIMTASPTMQPDGSKKIQVSLFTPHPTGPQLMRQTSVMGYPGEDEDQIYNRVMFESLKLLPTNPSTQTSQLTLEQASIGGSESVMAAQLNFSSVREWVQTKKTIENTSGVKAVIVQSMSPRAATLQIKYQGDVENFRIALSQSGMKLYDPIQGQLYRIGRVAPVSIY